MEIIMKITLSHPEGKELTVCGYPLSEEELESELKRQIADHFRYNLDHSEEYTLNMEVEIKK